MRRLLVPLLWPVICGVLLALVLLDHLPQMIGDPTAPGADEPGVATPELETVSVDRLPISRKPPVTREAEPLERGEGTASYSSAVEQAAPTVVNVYSSRLVERDQHPLMSDPFFEQFFGNSQSGRQRMLSSLGSGVIVSEEGYILTNNHVISGADQIQVALRDGREAIATVIGTDPETDLAVLRVDLENLPVIDLADSNHTRVGDIALAIGNPFGVGQTVTMGIISATGRNHLGLNAYEDFIQTDAAINPGNSGGALVNADGALVGINTAIFSRTGGSQGIGFAIPINLAHDILNDLVTHGRVVRGWLGIEAREVTSSLPASFNINAPRGVVVSDVIDDGPADRAGIEVGDLLLSVSGRPLLDAQSAMVDIAGISPGERLPLELYRDGRRFTVTVNVGERPSRPVTPLAQESGSAGP